MAHQHPLFNPIPFTYPVFESVERRMSARYERELTEHRGTEIRLLEALAQARVLLRSKDELIHHREILSRETDHRLMNGLQMIVSLLSRQSRAQSNADAAAQLTVAANRVATIASVHQRLHSLDGVKDVAFKNFLDELCREYSSMLAEDRRNQSIVVEGSEARLAAATAIPLSLIANELITNAVKHGGSAITVRLEAPEGGHLLSVCNNGRPLPQGFDPTASKGLGMQLVLALIEQIGGTLQIDRFGQCEGTRFAVAFA
jgi:two-component system, sensor histidine kinase PdtaS